ncbi:hypothetical protein BABINDRAFT_160077 [Babjeviella inositovora NRRL Y-12698]|uniref:Exocyst complex component Sec8 n=1 Tax=Babjeviella inositovora NRRL Y-12698 TaxID=984486 RepID=A0A1E3QW03_9ASCO|nr:uncharacterized protein BABINDRAFT_160077 [Babjeviella inositovora NRRL Y-12698]ODQ81845.1 hypothetical protein BABINDRAFT_160077 [Babjeviella inositovora NRRL Y-12698]
MSRRNRSFSVNSASKQQQVLMNRSLDDLETVLATAKRDWKQLNTSARNPLELALPLLDDSSVGLAHRYDEFQQLGRKVDATLRTAVKQHYDEFSNSIGSYGMLVKTISESQDETTEVRQMLAESSHELNDRKDMLSDLNQSSKRYTDMLVILEAIEELQACSERLDLAIAEKRFFQAHSVLAKAFSVAEAHGLWSLTALSGTRQHLESQENNLFDVIMEELHSVLYLKNATDVLRLVHTMDPSLDPAACTFDHMDVADKAMALNTKLTKFLGQTFTNELQGDDLGLSADFSTDMLAYIRSLLAVTKRMNRLDQALPVLIARHPAEYHQMVLGVTKEVRLEYASQLKTLAGLSAEALDVVGEMSADVVQSLFARVFVKTLVMLQGHRVVHETVAALASAGERKEMDYSFNSVWEPTRNELGSLIVAYISDDADVRGKRSSHKKTLFQYANISYATDSPHSRDLQSSLQSLFPGLAVTGASSLYLENEAFIHQDTLVPGSVLHMRAILDKFLVFCTASEFVFPVPTVDPALLFSPTKETPPMGFFADIMESNFAPQLEQYVMLRYTALTDGSDSFDTAVYDASQPPVFRSAIGFHNIFFELCEMFNTSAAFRPRYTNIVLKSLQIFTEKYALFASELLPDETSTSQISQWMQSAELHDVSLALVRGEGSDHTLQREIKLMLAEGIAIFNIGSHELFKAEAFDQTAQLLHSVSWVLSWLARVRCAVEETEPKDDWMFYEAPSQSDNSAVSLKKDHISIKLSGEALQVFDECVLHLGLLLDKALLTLRYDLGCKAIYGMGRLFNRQDWAPSGESKECDEAIVTFNKDILTCNNKLRHALDPAQKRGVLLGLPELIDQLLILGSDVIKLLNENGVKKMFLDISVLRQMLRTVTDNPEDVKFTLSLAYYDLFNSAERGIIQKVKDGESFFNFKQNRNMLRLVFSESVQSQNNFISGRNSIYSSGTSPSMKMYHEAVSKLQEAFGEHLER